MKHRLLAIAWLSACMPGNLAIAAEPRPNVVSWRWHTPGNNYMKSIDDFPFQFDSDQLFEINGGIAPQDTRNVAKDPANAEVLADMKAKLKQVLEPLEQPFGEFGTAYPPVQEPKPLSPKEQRKMAQ